MEARLEELRSEWKSGQEALAEIDARKHKLEQTMLRIAGAIQVLEELLENPAESVDVAKAFEENDLVAD